MQNLCDCKTECSRWGLYEDGYGGFFCPYSPFDEIKCKKVTGKEGKHIIPHTIK